MTARFSTTRTGYCLLALFLLSCCLSNDKVYVVGGPVPIPPVVVYENDNDNDNYVNSANYIVWKGVKQLETAEEEQIEKHQKRLYNLQAMENSLEEDMKHEANTGPGRQPRPEPEFENQPGFVPGYVPRPDSEFETREDLTYKRRNQLRPEPKPEPRPEPQPNQETETEDDSTTNPEKRVPPEIGLVSLCHFKICNMGRKRLHV